ncbi:hypothetical protein FA15DRAFT_709973 [Coprinopsis marcescibilis]|uniref:Ribonuclease H1 N-terminal domain-containing protein n=1 Tax=Coprinopsis marcescibilis TaxID=230819 RepID=A0A5C3KE88_COPMA|nr:hypothetical protein FA15DRAFT_709973 [Coprinopsis marcescibilis]
MFIVSTNPIQIVSFRQVVNVLAQANMIVVSDVALSQATECPLNLEASSTIVSVLEKLGLKVKHTPSQTVIVDGVAPLSLKPQDPAKAPTVFNPNRDGVTPGSGSADGTEQPGHKFDTLNGFCCASCHVYNLFQNASDTWYSVTTGLKTGVFKGWDVVEPLVNGVKDNKYKKCKDLKEATEHFQDAKANGRVFTATKIIQTKVQEGTDGDD